MASVLRSLYGILAVLSFTLSAAHSHAQILDHFGINSPEIEILDSAYIESGRTPPFFSRPFSNYQYLNSLKELDVHSKDLPEYYRTVFNKISKSLRQQKNEKAFIKPILDSNFRLQYMSDEMPESDRYLYYRKSLEEPPLLGLGFLGGTTHVLGMLYFDLRRDVFSGYSKANYVNLPIVEDSLQDLDYNFPTRGYIVIGNQYANILVGRDRLRWGPGYRGSLVLSDSPPYYNMINSSLSLPNFKYSLVYASLESYLTDEEYELQVERSKTGVLNYPKQNTDEYKSLVGHRIDFELFDRVMIGLSEIIVIGGRIPEFVDITPMMFFHNVYGENYSNVNVGLDIAVVPLRKILLYGEFMIEDIRNPEETEKSPPNSFGYMAGFRFVHSLASGALAARLEWVKVDPWVYNRWQPYSIFTSRKKILSLTGGVPYLDFPTGYFLGPDVKTLFMELSWSTFDRFSAKFNYEYRQKGRIYLDPLDPESNFVARLDEELVTPTGIPVISHIMGLCGDFKIRPWVTCSLELRAGFRKNVLHINGNDDTFFETFFNIFFSPF